jgi:polysaccharide biosynthesis protein PslG
MFAPSQPRGRRLVARCALMLSIAVALIGLAALAPGDARAAATGQTLFGINEAPIPADYPLQRALNAPVRRMVMGWNVVERTPGAWDWSQYDSDYEVVLAAGLRPLIVAAGAPCWTVSSGECDWGEHFPPDPEFDSGWSDFIAELVRRYPEAVGIEIWNEPNFSPVFGGAADPVRYTELLRLAYTAVKSVHPSMPVISGGLFGSPGDGEFVQNYFGWADHAFIAAVLSNGGGAYMDAIGIHPYAYPPTGALAAIETIGRIRAARDGAGAGQLPIWVTETGEPTASERYPEGVDALQQASDLSLLVRWIELQPDIPVALVHRLVDVASPQLWLSETGYGLFNSDRAPKATACALSSVWGGSLDCLAATGLPLAGDDRFTVARDAAATTLDVLANDLDPGDAPAAITWASDPTHGEVVIGGAGDGISYRPDPGYCDSTDETDGFVYQLADGSSATVFVIVGCVNTPPPAEEQPPPAEEQPPPAEEQPPPPPAEEQPPPPPAEEQPPTAGTDDSPPETTIKWRPRKRSKSADATFVTRASEPAARFLCRLDGSDFRPCRSRRIYRRLSAGAHVFRVVAVDAAGNADPTPAVVRWRVLGD